MNDPPSPQGDLVNLQSGRKGGRRLSTTHNPTLPLPQQQQLMAKDYRQLWKDVTTTSDEGKAVQTLAEILLDKEGGTFISDLTPKDAELCIEILDHVSRNSHLLSALAVSDCFFRVSLDTISKLPRNRLSLSR